MALLSCRSEPGPSARAGECRRTARDAATAEVAFIPASPSIAVTLELLHPIKPPSITMLT